MTGTLRSLQTFLVNDHRRVSRDHFLSRIVFLPLVYALMVRWIVPWVDTALQETLDLQPYYPLIVSYIVVTVLPLIWGMVASFLVLDDRDDRTLQAMQVTPVSPALFLGYRLVMVWVLGMLSIGVCLPLTGIAHVSWIGGGLSAAQAALSGCVVTLAMTLVAENKVQGFALFKILGTVVFIPVAAWFTPDLWQWAFGVIPFFWGMKVYWMDALNQEGIWQVMLIGVMYQLGLIALLLHSVLYRILYSA